VALRKVERFIKALGLSGQQQHALLYLSFTTRDTWTTKIVLSSGKGRLITTDKGWWYRRACRELDLSGGMRPSEGGMRWRGPSFRRSTG